MNAASDEELKRVVGNREIATALAQPGQFFGYCKSDDLALSVRGNRFEDDLLVEASDKLRAEELWSSESTARSNVVNGSRVGRKSCCEAMLLVQTM